MAQPFDMKKYIVNLTPEERDEMIKELSKTRELTPRDIDWIMTKTVEADIPHYQTALGS